MTYKFNKKQKSFIKKIYVNIKCRDAKILRKTN